MGERLPPGAVVVDMAGNCEEGSSWDQVTYLAPPNLPALLPVDASQMFARNMEALVEHLSGVSELRSDELLGPMLVEIS
jgi:NAD/NADP transhydrogenase alpha subunit